MTKHERRAFVNSLESEAADLRGALRDRGGIAIEAAAEECEQMSLLGQRELSLTLVAGKSRRLREIEVALRRIEDGGFGACIDCDEQIPVKRLAAIPWASRCVRCQSKVDSGFDRTDSPPQLFAA